MMSYGINHQVGVKASPKEIYEHLTETATPAAKISSSACRIQAASFVLKL
jgi:hypothetical protein